MMVQRSFSLHSSLNLNLQVEKLENVIEMGNQLKMAKKPTITSFWSAEEADPRPSGSVARRTSNRFNADEGKCLNVSATERMYGCVGLKTVA